MGLFPGWRAPEFPLVIAGRATTFHAWRREKWSVVLTRPADFTPASLRCGIASVDGNAVRLLGLCAPHTVPQGHVTAGAEFGGLHVVADPQRKIEKIWAGPQMELGPAEPPIEEHAAYLIAPSGHIRRTLSFLPGTQQDFTTVLRTLASFDAPFLLRDRELPYAA
ncbi:peroxidase [Neoasaia chiangmaiensis NBRC 101099]|uniref:Uncharacterized protein n=1 Tax=Neoasaia chiangmaiensis TaxID=320497 RepID=A0A1U9KS95_9PROT|nr:hypothetical protein [Neoasaia chiangmaiensis]AQS88754.1 hypothetical protein A0U93_13420 [Neoasaia chiangmaiensis]GBR40847.1 peroxidase [Neoasaia chiangmaiensis NBRC 101099]GEN13714.1 hypothetical protein NCH01_01450 [Neoasaia chiangmaiensis]